MSRPLAPLLADLDIAGIEQAMQSWVGAFDDAHPEALPDEPQSSVYLATTFGGRGDLHGSLSAAHAADLEALHTAGWHAKLLPDGTLHITTPRGRVVCSRPPDADRRPEPPT